MVYITNIPSFRRADADFNFLIFSSCLNGGSLDDSFWLDIVT